MVEVSVVPVLEDGLLDSSGTDGDLESGLFVGSGLSLLVGS